MFAEAFKRVGASGEELEHDSEEPNLSQSPAASNSVTKTTREASLLEIATTLELATGSELYSEIVTQYCHISKLRLRF